MNWWTRKLHRWGAILTALPMLLVIGSGLLLQVKKQVPWVQPPTTKGAAKNVTPQQSFDDLLAVVREVEEAEVDDWEDVNRLDVRPGKGIVKVTANNNWEIQIDLESGEVLSSTYRRIDLIESLHDGSFFSDSAKLAVFLPNGLILLGLWMTGMWLWYIPFASRRKKKKRSLAESNA